MIVIRNFLPGLTRIIKIRKKRLEAAQKTSSEFSEETMMTVNNYEGLLVSSADDFRQVLSTTSQEGSDWITTSTNNLERKDLSQLNKDYILLNGRIRSKSYVLQELIKG